MNGGGSYNKSIHSDVDSFKSSLKHDSFDILSNSDKSNEQQKNFKLAPQGLFLTSDRDYIKCRGMQKIMAKIGLGKGFVRKKEFLGREHPDIGQGHQDQSV